MQVTQEEREQISIGLTAMLIMLADGTDEEAAVAAGAYNLAMKKFSVDQLAPLHIKRKVIALRDSQKIILENLNALDKTIHEKIDEE